VAFDRNVNGGNLRVSDAKWLHSAGGGEVTAALCARDKPVISASAGLRGISSSQEQEFAKLMKFVALDLFSCPLSWRG